MKIKLGALGIEYDINSIKFAYAKHSYPKDTLRYYPEYPPPVSSIYMYEVEVVSKVGDVDYPGTFKVLLSMSEVDREVLLETNEPLKIG